MGAGNALYFLALLCNGSPALFRRLLLPLLLAAQVAAAGPALDTVAKVRALSMTEAVHGLPVRLDATVVYFDPTNGDLFVQDDTATIYLGVPSLENLDKMRSLSLKPGARIRIEATTKGGGFSPDLLLERFTLIGKGPLPEPRRIADDELLSPALDSQWVEVPAVITGVESDDRMFTLTVEVHGWKLKARLPRNELSAERAAALMQRMVRLHGIAATMFNPQGQMAGRYFFVQSFDQIIPTDDPAPNNSGTLSKINELLRHGDTTNTLVRIEGVVTQKDGNDFYLRDESGSVMVRTAGKDSFNPGDRVEAQGFAAIAPFRPVLRANKVALIGRAGLPQPMTLDFGSEKFPLFQGELIELTADFLARSDGTGEVALQCRMGERFFEALLPSGGLLPKGLAPGDRVRLTGICELTTTHPLAVFWNVNGFRLHLPKSGGVIILQHAPWWTLEHVLALLGIVAAVALLALAWGWLLAHRVKAQTKIIGGQIQKAAVHDERQRIARELHDTVEQQLASLTIQQANISEVIRITLNHVPDQIRAVLSIAQKMLTHIREEARTSIRDLRNIELEQRGLLGALRELLPEVVTGCDAEFQLNATGKPRHLEGITETHLLRIAQEGVANAAHHAAARKITVNLDYTPETVTLSIRDDGCGFNPAAPPPDGHFGLRGIRERANKIQAASEIQSAPGKGTFIRVVVPANDQKTEN
jgi:signal transduction histidine kinase